MILNFNDPWDPVKMQFLIQQVWGVGQDAAHLTNSQVVPTLLIAGLSFI